MKIFCHYYNNDKECPYDDQCIYAHEENDDDQDDESLIKIEDLEPSLKKVEEAMEKVKVMIQKQTSILKCDQCEFEARNSNGLTMHKKAKHTVTDKA